LSSSFVVLYIRVNDVYKYILVSIYWANCIIALPERCSKMTGLMFLLNFYGAILASSETAGEQIHIYIKEDDSVGCCRKVTAWQTSCQYVIKCE